jgi:hypothetical protein
MRMKRSQLKESIKTILKRKLYESISDLNKKLAFFISNKSQQGEIKSVQIQTHYGDKVLEPVEWWTTNDGVLHISVNNQDESITEIDALGTNNVDTNRQQPIEDPEVQMSDQDVKSLADLNDKQQKFTNDKNRLAGAIQKLEDPVRKKVADAKRKMSDIEKKLGQVTKKIQDIQNKYK